MWTTLPQRGPLSRRPARPGAAPLARVPRRAPARPPLIPLTRSEATAVAGLDSSLRDPALLYVVVSRATQAVYASTCGCAV